MHHAFQAQTLYQIFQGLILGGGRNLWLFFAAGALDWLSVE